MTAPKGPIKHQSAFEKMLVAPILDEKSQKAIAEMKVDINKNPRKPQATDGFISGGASLGLVQTGKGGGGGSKEKTVGNHGITKAQFHVQVQEHLKAGVQKALTAKVRKSGDSFLTDIASGRVAFRGLGKTVKTAMKEAAQAYVYNQVSYKPLRGKEVGIRYHNNDKVWVRMAHTHAEKQKGARTVFVAQFTKGVKVNNSSSADSQKVDRKVDRMLSSLPSDSAPEDIVDQQLETKPKIKLAQTTPAAQIHHQTRRIHI